MAKATAVEAATIGPLFARAPSSARSAGKARRTHSERREEAERRMLRSAVKIVAERGLEDLTLVECGEAAGYSRGLAAHYFGSRERLLVAIATHIVQDYTQRFRSSGRIRGGLEGLLDSAGFYFDSGRENITALRAFHAVLGSAFRQTPQAQAISQLNCASVDWFASLIRQGIEERKIRADVDAVAQATLILSALRGAMAQWLLNPKRVDLDALKSELLASLRRSLSR